MSLYTSTSSLYSFALNYSSPLMGLVGDIVSRQQKEMRCLMHDRLGTIIDNVWTRDQMEVKKQVKYSFIGVKMIPEGNAMFTHKYTNTGEGEGKEL